MNKIIVAGGRDFNNYSLLERTLDSVLIRDQLEIVSGTARRADRLGEKYAEEHNIPVKRFPADWDKHGKSAGYKRNEEMAEYGDALVAFWNGQSRGTKHMIELAKKYNLKIRVIHFST